MNDKQCKSTLENMLTSWPLAIAEAEALRHAVKRLGEMDSNRLVWVMCSMTPNLSREFALHVLKRGGTGDLSDCRSFVDSHMPPPEQSQ